MRVSANISFNYGRFVRSNTGALDVQSTRTRHDRVRTWQDVVCRDIKDQRSAFVLKEPGQEGPHFENMLALFGLGICSDFLTHVGVGHHSLDNISPFPIEVNDQQYLVSFMAGGRSWTLNLSLPRQETVAMRAGVICW